MQDEIGEIRTLLRRSYHEGRGPHGRTILAVDERLDRMEEWMNVIKRRLERILTRLDRLERAKGVKGRRILVKI